MAVSHLLLPTLIAPFPGELSDRFTEWFNIKKKSAEFLYSTDSEWKNLSGVVEAQYHFGRLRGIKLQRQQMLGFLIV